MKVKVIVAVNEASLRAAMQATSTIPIVVIAYDRKMTSLSSTATVNIQVSKRNKTLGCDSTQVQITVVKVNCKCGAPKS